METSVSDLKTCHTKFFLDEVAKLLTAFYCLRQRRHFSESSPLPVTSGNDRLRKYPTQRKGTEANLVLRNGQEFTVTEYPTAGLVFIYLEQFQNKVS